MNDNENVLISVEIDKTVLKVTYLILTSFIRKQEIEK